MWLITMSTCDRHFVAFTDLDDRTKAMTACKRQIRRLAGKRLHFTAMRCVRFEGGNVALEIGASSVEWEAVTVVLQSGPA